MNFEELGLAQPLLRAVAAEGYSVPTPIQSLAVPHIIAGRDLLGCAQTGTGKTAAFALPILHQLHQTPTPATPRSPRVLVLSPTRELAAQIGQSFATYGCHMRFHQAVIYGGVGAAPQIKSMVRGVHILVATPGRLLDLMNQGHIRLDRVTTFVLDEADRMLDMGFMPDITRIVSRLPKVRQTLFFSATMPPKIGELANELLQSPVRVAATPPSTTVSLIEQRAPYVDRTQKRALLQQLLRDSRCDRVLVFTRTKHGADKVATQLTREGMNAHAIHGNKSQSARSKTLAQFRSGKVRVLVATDLASRGIDVEGISHVINYDIPIEPEAYVHRIGRTGRAGANGVAWSLCDSSERTALRAIEKLVQHRIEVHVDHPVTKIASQSSSAPEKSSSQGSHRKFSYGGRRNGNSGPKPNRRRYSQRAHA